MLRIRWVLVIRTSQELWEALPRFADHIEAIRVISAVSETMLAKGVPEFHAIPQSRLGECL